MARFGGEPDEEMGGGEGLPCRAQPVALDLERLPEADEQSPVGGFGATAPHLVQVVTCQRELGAGVHLDLGEGDKVIEAGLSRELLAQEPADVVERGAL